MNIRMLGFRTPTAIVAGACIVGAAIVVAKLIAPYGLATSDGGIYRINAVTGTVAWCMPADSTRGVVITCK